MWHRCSQYWRHNAPCPVRGREEHEEDEEDDQEPRDKPLVAIPEQATRPAEPDNVLAVAEAIVREVQTREVEVRGPFTWPQPPPATEPVPVPTPPLPVPEWVPAPADLVVPTLYPTPPTVSVPYVPGVPTVGSGSTITIAPGETPWTPSIGGQIVEGTIAAGVGVAVAIAAAPALPWVSRIVTISRILLGLRSSGLAPQTGMIGLPAARTLLAGVGMMAVRTAVSRIPESNPAVTEAAKALVEQVVVDYIYPTAAQRSVAISKALAGLSKPAAPPTVEPYEPSYASGWKPGGGTTPGGHGYLYDFGNYLNTQLDPFEGPIPGGSPAPTTY